MILLSLKMKRYLILIILCAVSFFAHNGTILPDIMESRNIVTAREMVTDGNWMVPTMNGELRLEKPPLPTWIAAVVEEITPDNISAQRAVAGVFAMMGIIFFFLLGKKMFRNEDAAFTATLLLLTCYNVVLMGRTATWDIYCHAFMLGALYYLYRALYEHRHIYCNFIMAGIFLGLSFLSKGPVSFYALLLPFVIGILIFRRPLMRGRWLPFALMIVICLVISAWWYVYLLIFYPDMSQYVIHKESSSWVDRNVRPWWYYWRFFLETGVWSLLMVTTLLFWWSKDKLKYRNQYMFFIVWTLVDLVLLSFMPEKKMRYLLPMMIPCCYSMACIVEYAETQVPLHRKHYLLYYLNTGLIALICVALPVVLYIMFYVKGSISLSTMILYTLLIWVIASLMIVTVCKRRPKLFLWCVVLLFAVAELLMMPLIASVTNNPDFRSIRETREVKQLAGLPFYYNSKEELRIELVYEANRKIRPLHFEDEREMMRSLPCAVVTRRRVGEELSKRILSQVDTVYIGQYDDNRRPKGNKHYNDLFFNHVTILKHK